MYHRQANSQELYQAMQGFWPEQIRGRWDHANPTTEIKQPTQL